MRDHLGRPFGALLSAGLLSSALLSAVGTGGTAASAAAAANEVTARASEPDVDLPKAFRGARAVDRLGDQLDEAAHLNGQTARELRTLLLEDRSVWVDREGHLFYVDEAHEPSAAEVREAQAAPQPAAAPLADTFLLHSKPGSARTIFLDFDGAEVRGTAWNSPTTSTNAVPNGFHEGWSMDGLASFDDAERALVQEVWQRVAEDFAAFDVDVTTQDPGVEAIRRSSASDEVFGTRVLMSESATAYAGACGSECGGVAYLNAFDAVGADHDYYQPAWVFPEAMGHYGKAIAEATSHEVGHHLGLKHDGIGETNDGSYYAGHGSWAPIMGVGYDMPITQWSRGDYLDANNHEDDYAVMAEHQLATRADEAGADVATAAPAVPATAYVSTPSDVDVFRLGHCSGPVTVAVDNAEVSPDLDVAMRVLDSAGAPVAAASPATLAGDPEWDVAEGMDAAVATDVADGVYFVEVDGVGDSGFADNGYDDYGSLGAYTVGSTGCATIAAPATAPGAPGAVTATPARSTPSVTVTWQPPAVDGGSAVTGYTVTPSVGDPVTLGATARSHGFQGLAHATEYTFTVAATNAAGTGTGVAVSTTTAPEQPPTTVPDAPRELSVVPRALDGAADLSWAPPTSDGGSPVTGYVLSVDGEVVDTLPASASGAELLDLLREQPYAVEVAAVNEVGTGPAVAATVTLAGPPPAPASVDLQVSGTTGTVTWTAPAGYDPDLVTDWWVIPAVDGTMTRLLMVEGPDRSVVLRDLPVGEVVVEVVALSGDLAGDPAFSPTVAVVAPAATVPGSPRIGTPASGRRGGAVTATARWVAPAIDGGAALDGYQVHAHRLDQRGRVRATYPSRVVSPGSRAVTLRLPKGRYRFSVRAHNSEGYGPLSARSGVVSAR